MATALAGQGSGASLLAKLSLVVLLLNTLEKLISDRVAFESPTRTMQHIDTSLGLTDPFDNNTMEQIIDCLQSIAQTWERYSLSLNG